MVNGRRAGIDEDPGAAHDLVVAFAHVRAVGADQVKVGAGFQPGTPDKGRGRHGRGGDHICLAHRCLKVRLDRGAGRLGKSARRIGAAGPDMEPGAGKDRRIGLHHRKGDGPAADQQEMLRPLAGKMTRG